MEELIVDVDNVLTGIRFDTLNMNILELACALGLHDIFTFLVKDMNLRSSRDFHVNRQNKMIHEQFFVYVPILKRN